MNTYKEHWEKIYATKNSNEVSWTENSSWAIDTILPFIELKKTDSIIDIGAGEARFAKEMFDKGFEKLTVIDIAENALLKAKQHVGLHSENINWLVTDVLKLQLDNTFDLWYDRAVFHFLTDNDDIQQYVDKVFEYARKYVLIGTFALDGPNKCSGLPILQYSADKLYKLFESNFNFVNSYAYVHRTPFETDQSFQFILMKRK